MKKVLLSITIVIVSIIAFTYQTEEGHTNRNGAPAGRTGSPADGSNCSVSCHTSTAVSNSPNGVITSTIPTTGYVPGQTYTITGTVTGTGLVRFGFEISPQAVNGTLRGTPVITDATNTQIVSTKYVTHKNAGTSGTNSRAWSFNWVAPAAGTGAFSFYGAFNAANNNNNDDSGDKIYLATLPINEAAQINTQPAAQAVCAGATATFTVAATGTNITYLWKKNGVALTNGGNIAGATSATLTISNTSQTDADNYTVEVTGSGNTVISNSVALTVNAATAIGTQPTGQAFCIGGSINLSVTATGQNLNYQWKRGTTNVGTNSPTLVINNATANDVGQYTVVITGTCGNATSNPVAVTLNNATVITTQPQPEILCFGESVTLTTVATGSGTLSYQWKKGTTPVGSNSSSFTINNAQSNDNGDYTVEVTGACGTVVSNIAGIFVTTVPVIAQQPQSQTVCAGTPAFFDAFVSGNVAYQWYVNNVPSGSPGGPTFGGNFANGTTVYAIILGGCEEVSTDTVTVTVLPATLITTQPAALQSACVGSDVSFTISATASNISYQWKKGGNNIIGQTSSTLNLTNISLNDAATYTCVVMGDCDTLTSNNAVLSIAASANISQQPLSQTICIGNPVTLTVVGNAGSNTTYQWFRNNQPVGINSPSFDIPAATINSAGNYKVTITGDCGTITSNIATLSIGTTTAVNNIFTNTQVCENSAYSLGVSADGTNLTYQWLLNSNSLVNETSATLNIPSLVEGNSGLYQVQVNGDCGNITANIATIDVIALPQITGISLPLPFCQGSAVDLTIQTTGDNLVYQWYKNAAEIPGANDVFYSDVAPANNDVYTCKIWNTCDTITSGPIAVTVLPAPNPQVVQGGPFTLTVSNGPFVAYQWLDANAGVISGEFNSTFNPPVQGTYYVTVTDANGCADTSNAIIYFPESVGENLAAQIKIYPNPSNGTVYFSMPNSSGNFTVTILNSTGQLVMNATVENNYLNIAQLPAGIYTVSTLYKSQPVHLRLAKQ